ncbi:MAG: phosphotransferase family protein [Gammaproteobacteria bacterium]|nr:phosphotransferase family protein [Gammaproteobacteria bacterium]
MVRRFGTEAGIDNVVFTTVGGSNLTVLFDLIDGAARRRLVFRQETIVPENSPFLDPSRQFRVLQLLHPEGLPVPEPIFEFDADDSLARAYVVAFVDGESLPRRLLDAPNFAPARQRFCAQAGEFLGRLHALDPAPAEFLADFPDSIDPIAATMGRIDRWGVSLPALELAVRWLERNRPSNAPRRLLHGDFRTGNMLMDEQGIRAVLDYECAHLGAPMEDLGWLCLRSFRFGHVDKPVGGFGPREPFYAAYAAASGKAVDPEEVRWWEIFGFIRWAHHNVMQMYGHVTGARRSTAFAACGRNIALIEYELLMTLQGHYT